MPEKSVGRIQLDLEISQKSLQKEVSSVGTAFSKSLQSAISAPMGFLQKSFANLAAGMKGLTFGGGTAKASREVEELSARFDGSVSRMQKRLNSLQASFDKTQGSISAMSQRLAGLYAEQDAIIEGYRNMPALTGLTSDQSLETLLASDQRFKALTALIDQLQAKMQPLADKSQQAKEEVRLLGLAMTDAGTKAAQSGAGMQTIRDKTKQAGDMAQMAGKKFGGFSNVLTRSLMTVMRRVFVYNVLLQGIRSLVSYMGTAFKTNKQFATSLGQIRANLKIAFMPVYNAVLPAINALMRGLASATTYIASFTARLFGSTYKGSLEAAKGLETAKKAMEDLEKSKGSLSDFDQLNVIGTPAADTSLPDIAAVEEQSEGMVGRLKEAFATLFHPFAAAWASEGQGTMASIIDAFTGLRSFITEVGKSFAAVWANGSGQALLEGTLQVLQNIFATVGNIGRTFAEAWTNAGIGSSIVQGVFNVAQNLLDLVGRIGESMQKAWGEHGSSYAATFLGIVSSTVGVLETLTEKLLYVWDNGGKYLYENLFRLGVKLFELAGYIYTEFVTPLVSWFAELIAPAIAKVLEWTGWLLDKFTSLISWLLGDGKPVLDTIVTILGSMAAAFGLVTTAIKIWKVVTAVGTAIAGGFGTAIAFLTSTVGLWVLAIGAVIAIGVLLYKNWDDISAWLTNTWEGLQTSAVSKFNGIRDGIRDALTPIGKFFSDLWAGVKTGFVGFVNFIIQGVNTMIENFLKPVNALISGWNGTVGRVTGQIPTITLAIPKIPKLANGGIVDQPTLAMVGDNKNARVDPEVITPLSKLQEMLGQSNQAVVEVLLAILDAIEKIDPSFDIDGERLNRILRGYERKESSRVGKAQVTIGGVPV